MPRISRPAGVVALVGYGRRGRLCSTRCLGGIGMKNRAWMFVAVWSMFFTALLAGPVAAGGPPMDPPGLDQAIAAQEAHTDALLAKPGVVGTAVGLGADGRPVVKIYTETERVAGLPAHLDGVPVEVEVTGDLVAQTDLFARPAPIGVSSGTERLIVYRGQLYCTTGTLGARVTDGTSVFALSAAHVYALEGSKPDGTVQVGVNGDPILVPGRVDMADQACGSQQEIDKAEVGRLVDYVPIVFSRTANNTVDAAIAGTSPAEVDIKTPAGGYGTPSSTIAPAVLNQAVQKYGRTTGSTKGKVTGVNATVLIKYDTGRARFVNQIVFSSMSAGGDSGSLIVTDDGNNSPVALLFAGSSSSTIGNPIGLVLSAFGVTIDGGP